jgi:SulP family sulfate permease
VSEPASPDERGPHVQKLPPPSALAEMIRRSPPTNEGTSGQESVDTDHEDDQSLHQAHLTLSAEGLKVDPTEQTPLLGRNAPSKRPHTDWIRGQQDLEGQRIRTQTSWPNLRNVLLWPRETGYDIALAIANPKRWDRKAIWQSAVLAPINTLPAVILGVLLNVLDALSYGKLWRSLSAFSHGILLKKYANP